jgi:hypothetical protein
MSCMRGLKPKASMSLASSTHTRLLDFRAKPLLVLTASLCNMHIVQGYDKVELGVSSKYIYISRDELHYSTLTLHTYLQP